MKDVKRFAYATSVPNVGSAQGDNPHLHDHFDVDVTCKRGTTSALDVGCGDQENLIYHTELCYQGLCDPMSQGVAICVTVQEPCRQAIVLRWYNGT